MKNVALFKLALVACLMIVGFGVAEPASAAVQVCEWEYCNANPSCNCKCWNGSTWDYYICNQAPRACLV